MLQLHVWIGLTNATCDVKGINTIFIYNVLKGGFPKSNGAWPWLGEKRIQVVITSGVRNKV